MFNPSKLAIRSTVNPPRAQMVASQSPTSRVRSPLSKFPTAASLPHTRTQPRVVCVALAPEVPVFFRLLRCTRNRGQTIQTDWISSSLLRAPILWQILPHPQPRAIAIPITYVRHYPPPTKEGSISVETSILCRSVQ